MMITIEEDEKLRINNARKLLYGLQKKAKIIDNCEGSFIKDSFDECFKALNVAEALPPGTVLNK